MDCPNCDGMMHYDGEMWECFECGETLVEEDYDEDGGLSGGGSEDYDEEDEEEGGGIDWMEFEQGFM